MIPPYLDRSSCLCPSCQAEEKMHPEVERIINAASKVRLAKQELERAIQERSQAVLREAECKKALNEAETNLLIVARNDP